VTLDARARRAARDFRRSVEDLDRAAPDRSSFARFDQVRRRKQRNARVGVIVLASIVTIVATIVATRAFPQAEQPGVPPTTNGRIAFVRYDHHSGKPDAFSMDPDGSQEAQMLTSRFFSGHSESPHWSPDGTQVSIFCCSTGTSPQIVNLDAGILRQVAPADPGLEQYCGFAWSPDGRRLACGNFGMDDPRKTGLWTIVADGGDPRQVTSNPGGEDSPGDFSPDGTHLVFARKTRNGRTLGIFVVNVDGTGLQRITPSGMLIDGFPGSWSPIGNQILFVASTDAQHRRAIWEVNADGSGLHQVPIAGCGGAIKDPGSFDCSYPGWSPDGTQIVFTLRTENGRRSDIAIVNADGSGLGQITHSGDADEADWGTHPLAS
jgi:Tol biopolymer transport system component